MSKWTPPEPVLYTPNLQVASHYYTLGQLLAVRREAIEECKKLVLDDAWATTFQTFGQYRTALADAIRKLGEDT